MSCVIVLSDDIMMSGVIETTRAAHQAALVLNCFMYCSIVLYCSSPSLKATEPTEMRAHQREGERQCGDCDASAW